MIRKKNKKIYNTSDAGTDLDQSKARSQSSTQTKI